MKDWLGWPMRAEVDVHMGMNLCSRRARVACAILRVHPILLRDGGSQRPGPGPTGDRTQQARYRSRWADHSAVEVGEGFVSLLCFSQPKLLIRPGLEPGISGSGGRRLIH